MEKTIKTLQAELWCAVAVVVGVVIAYEGQLLFEGALTGDAHTGTHLLTQMWMVVAALVGIPVALKLFSLRYVRDRLTADESRSPKALLAWGTLRLALLALPMVADALCYYLFGDDVRFFYLALIEALALFFVYPSRRRCESETDSAEK